MRIGIVTPNPIDQMGGVERFTRVLADQLQTRGVQVTVFDRTYVSKKRPRWQKRIGVAEALDMGDLAYPVFEAWEKGLIDAALQNGIAGWRLGSLAPEMPRLIVHHGTWKGVAPKLLPRHPRLRSRLANRVLVKGMLGLLEGWASYGAISVAVSGSVASELRDLYGISSEIILNGIDCNLFKPRPKSVARRDLGLPVAAHDVLVGFSGRLEHSKGSEILRAIAERAARQLPRIKLLLAVDRAVDGWPENTIMLERVPFDQMPLFYNACDIFVFPSRYEGASFSVMEAMASGVAPVLSDVGHAKDIANQNALLSRYIVPDLDVELFWRSLVELTEDPERREQVALGSREYAVRFTDVSTMVESYLSRITKLVQDRQAGHATSHVSRRRLKGSV